MIRWQNALNVGLGLWVMISPWGLGFSAAQEATWTTAVLGSALVVFAGAAAVEPRTWEEAMIIVLGLAVMVSPWLVGFAPGLSRRTSAEIAGVLVVALGIWALAAERPVLVLWRHKRSKHSLT
jgi:hypothetical protein